MGRRSLTEIKIHRRQQMNEEEEEEERTTTITTFFLLLVCSSSSDSIILSAYSLNGFRSCKCTTAKKKAPAPYPK